MADSRTTCCVIGGAGFIGVQVPRLLLASGRRVVVLGRRARPPAGLPSAVTYVSGDYGDPTLLNALLEGAGEVIDLAYSTVPQTSFADPVFDIVSSLPPTVGLLQAAVAAKVRKVVLVSSGGTVYGVARSLPIQEDHPTHPISPYGITKLTIEKYAGMFHFVSDLPVVVVRPGNAYGEEQRPFAGQGFISTAAHSIIARQEIAIFGAEGTVRDYVHVSDVASGIIAALEHGRPGGTYNIGTGAGRSNRDVVKVIDPLAQAAGFEVRVKTLPARRFDVPANVLDSRNLEAVSGWRPAVEFEQGIARVWAAALARQLG